MGERHFPMFIDISGRDVLIAGGGTIAERRVYTLLKFGARIKVVAIKVSDKIRKLGDEGIIIIENREYKCSDMDGCVLAVAATNSREINRLIGIDAGKKGIFVSVADRREESTFFFPAVFEDDVIVGGLVSKEGRDHEAVRRRASEIREFLKGGEHGSEKEN